MSGRNDLEFQDWVIAKAAEASGSRLPANTIRVEKADLELGILWGWVSAADIVDLDDEIVPQSELVTAWYQFMEDYYLGRANIRENHGDQPAEAIIVESTLEFRAGVVRAWVGVKLLSDELREAARNGEISGFSIGGSAIAE